MVNTRKGRRRRETPPPRMKFEDWIRDHVTQERLKRVESVLEEDGLYPPSELFNFGGLGLVAEIVYRIHHDSFKAISFSESMATTSLEQLLYLFFGETEEPAPLRVPFTKQTGEATTLKVSFLKHLRSRRSNLYNYFVVVERAAKRLEEWRGGEHLHFDITKDSLKILGAAMFWYVTLLACIEVSKKVLADEKWERGAPLTWDEATAEYVAYWFSTRKELRSLWWPPSKAATNLSKKFKSL